MRATLFWARSRLRGSLLLTISKIPPTCHGLTNVAVAPARVLIHNKARREPSLEEIREVLNVQVRVSGQRE